MNMETSKKALITVHTTIHLPIHLAWKIWTTPSDIMHWNKASDEWHTPLAENDLRVGGKFCYQMAAKDGSMAFDFDGVYSTVNRLKLIEYKLSDDRVVRVNFTAMGNDTYIVEEFEAEEVNSLDIQKIGWQAILNSFKNYCESM